MRSRTPTETDERPAGRRYAGRRYAGRRYAGRRQHTLAREVAFDGIGMHSGSAVRAVVRPAPEGHGIAFARLDVPGSPPIPATLERVVDTTLATTLGIDGVRVGTVEHLLAALRGLEIDNARVEVDGPEVPILDGSAIGFVRALTDAGRTAQDAPAPLWRVVSPVSVDDHGNDRSARLEPHDAFAVDCEIAFDHPLLRHQRVRFDGDPRRFAAEIAPARTFGLLADVEAMHAAELARGGGLANAVVFGPDEVLNPGGLRFADECARHKLLDMIGDLALLGGAVLGAFHARRSGHGFNLGLVREALQRGALQRVAGPDRPDLR